MRADHLARHREKAFGITADDYATMLKAQDGVCAVCGEPEKARSKRAGSLKTLAVDHDHVTGKIRGLLCGRCNTALGLLDDDPARIRLLLTYMDRKKEGW